jgi:hypothetical protein
MVSWFAEDASNKLFITTLVERAQPSSYEQSHKQNTAETVLTEAEGLRCAKRGERQTSDHAIARGGSFHFTRLAARGLARALPQYRYIYCCCCSEGSSKIELFSSVLFGECGGGVSEEGATRRRSCGFS